MSDLKHLVQFATVRQLEYIEAVEKHGTLLKAARALGVNHRTLSRSMESLKRRAASQGWSPEHDMRKPAAPGFNVRGTSTLYDADGQLKAQWVKTAANDEQRGQILREWIMSMAESVKPLPPVKVPRHLDADLLSVYPMGDPHFGMYAWAREAGDDFDLAEADRLTRGAIDRLVGQGPASQRALLLNLGDFFHADDSSNQTPTSHHALDIDSRYAKVMQVGLQALTYCIERLLQKHETVEVWNMPGNHDPHSSFAVSLCLASFFAHNTRVEVDLSPSLYKYLRWGKVLLGAHHGHGAKPVDLPLVMASDRAADWGATEHRHWYCGHIHHRTQKEHPGVTVETFRTLAPRDAWHAGKGYRAGRDMNLIVHHREFGEVLRARCDVAMLKAAA